MLILPLTVVLLGDLIGQYRSWQMIEVSDAADIQFGMSLMRALVPLVRRSPWDSEAFRVRFGCSLLMFVALFNHQIK